MKKTYQYLTYAGLIPFIVCAICLIFKIHHLPILGSTEKIMSVYALVITSFLAGICWGQHLNLKTRFSSYLAIFSNIIAVAIWLAFLLLPFKFLLATFIAAFVALLLIDLKLFANHLITHEYFKTRCFVTIIVTSTLFISVIL
jgi:hypothetical protein